MLFMASPKLQKESLLDSIIGRSGDSGLMQINLRWLGKLSRTKLCTC
jgi:hypothetical protein